jgi:iron uptake system EfeUOB component EfeO/EfeM
VVGVDAGTHHERCPDIPAQPSAKDKGKGKAIANTLSLKKKEKKEAQAGLQAEVDEWHAEVEKKVEELATRHQLLWSSNNFKDCIYRR